MKSVSPPSLVTVFVFLLHLSTINAKDYYWVGGSGNWSDISHWMTTSGGTTQHSQTPTAEDNVYFDANSFTAPGQTVSIDIDVIFCRDLDFTGSQSPRFVGTDQQSLHIFGSLTLSTNMRFDIQGDIYFRSTEKGNEINWFGHRVRRDIIFDNTLGGWKINDGMQVDSFLVYHGGDLDMSGQQHQIYRFVSESYNTRQLDISNAQILVSAPKEPHRIYRNHIVYPIEWITQGLLVSAEGTRIELNAPNAGIHLIGHQNVSLGDVFFSSSIGKAEIAQNNDRSRTDQTAHFVTLQFNSHGSIFGQNNIETLRLARGKTYKLESAIRQAVRSIEADGTCENSILLLATSAGIQATIQSPQGQMLSYLTVRDINVQGGGAFMVDEAVDLGNNAGWSFSSRSPRDLYWVGNSGDWSDPSHWSLSDGGAGGECPPTAIDNVQFTATSFGGNSQVRLNVEDALCHDMQWLNLDANTQLEGGGTLHIFGSTVLDSRLEITKRGHIVMAGSDSDLTIRSNGVTFADHLDFNGTGTWTLQDQLSVEDSLMFIKGSLSTDDNDINTGYFLSIVGTRRYLDLGASTIRIRDKERARHETHWFLNTTNLTLESGTSHIIVEEEYSSFRTDGESTVTYHDLTIAPYGGNSSIYVNQYAYANFNEVTINQYTYISGRQHFHILKLYQGKTYTIGANDTIGLDSLESVGTCEFPITIVGDPFGIGYMQSDHHIEASFTNIKNNHGLGPGSFKAQHSSDLGSNKNWSFDDEGGTQRYWVGGTGNWHDTDHWSLTSGGTPGACIPTIKDDVFFDQNSFTGPSQFVYLDRADGFTKSISWLGSEGHPTFICNLTLWVAGSSRFIEEMESFIWLIQHISDSLDQTVYMGGQTPSHQYFSGTGSWVLEDSLITRYSTNYLSGDFSSASHKIRSEHFRLGSDHENLQCKLDFDTSRMLWTGTNFDVWADHLQVDADHSVIESINDFPRMTMHKNSTAAVRFHDLIFSSLHGESQIYSWPQQNNNYVFNKIQFYNDGYIDAELTSDTLIFAAGKTYHLRGGGTQLVNEYFQARGNNCAQLNVRSIWGGQKANVRINGEVNMDFVQMQDQSGMGSASLYAGNHSTNIGNSNTGWIFDSAPDYVEDGILGEDQVLCTGGEITLDANSYTPGETYLWNNGSVDQMLMVTQRGTYAVRIQFNNNCVLEDSINIFDLEDFTPDLGQDTVLCEGQTIALDATVRADAITYQWQDGSTDSAFLVESPGMYSVLLELSGCTATDSVDIAFVSVPDIDLGPDKILCDETSFTIDPSVDEEGATYSWQDQTQMATFTTSAPGVYWVDVTTNGCTSRDSMIIQHVTPPDYVLPPDTSICLRELVSLNADVGVDADYLWQDSSTLPVFMTDEPGTYKVAVSIGDCEVTATTLVAQKPSPAFDLGPDTLLCPTQTLSIDISQPGVSFSWSDHHTNPVRVLDSAGRYMVEGMLDGCTTRDTINVAYHEPVTPSLGPDTTVCEDFGIILTPPVADATYTWSNGTSQPTFVVDQPGVYSVIADDGICQSADTVEISFRPCIYFQMYQPNAFTPNNDGVNDEFAFFLSPNVLIREASLQIFDRWGGLLHDVTTQSTLPVWDGTSQGRFLQGGVYLYQVQVEYRDDHGENTFRDTGTVNLLR